MMQTVVLILFTTWSFFFDVSFATDRTSAKVYVNLDGFSHCFRRLNATHQAGCSTSRGGEVGVLHYIQNDNDLQWLIDHGPHKPYIVLLTGTTFNKSNIDELRSSGKINGILVIQSSDNEPPVDGFSPDKECPNDGYGLYDDHCNDKVWNNGNGMGFEDFDIPIMIITQAADVKDLIENCYNKFNAPIDGTEARDYPLCSVQVKDAMDAAKDTPTCMRRSSLQVNLNPVKYCDPLENLNVHLMTKVVESNETQPDESVVMVSARIDSFSMFDKIYPSADSSVTGLVTMLAAIEALSGEETKHTLEQADKNIMFNMFHGEAYDYIGSSRAVYDLMQGKFPNAASNTKRVRHPVGMASIDSFIELSQVGLPSDEKIYLHTDPNTLHGNIHDKVAEIANTLKTQGSLVGLEIADTGRANQLPPSSLQTFLKKGNISGLVLANYDTAYSNRYYNSRFDNWYNVHMDYPASVNTSEAQYNYPTSGSIYLQKVATTLARTLYIRVTGETEAPHINADNTTVANLMYCFLRDPRCDIFRTILTYKNAKDLASQPYPFYVSVRGDDASNWIPNILYSLIAYYTGVPVPNVQSTACKDLNVDDHIYTYTWMQGPNTTVNGTTDRWGVCMKSQAMSTIARSPAFDIDDYEWDSNLYSSWTESIWSQENLLIRMFLVPSKKQELITLCTGLAMLVLSLSLMYVCNKRAGHLFSDNSL